jgi:hypothetical protein
MHIRAIAALLDIDDPLIQQNALDRAQLVPAGAVQSLPAPKLGLLRWKPVSVHRRFRCTPSLPHEDEAAQCSALVEEILGRQTPIAESTPTTPPSRRGDANPGYAPRSLITGNVSWSALPSTRPRTWIRACSRTRSYDAATPRSGFQANGNGI